MRTEEQLPVCDVGDKFYLLNRNTNEITEIECLEIEKQFLGHFTYKFDNGKTYLTKKFGKNIFESKTQAEYYVKESQLKKKKRELLKQYELELNKALKLENHFIIK